MKVGCCSIKFHLHGNRSLKGKRRILNTIRDRVKNNFNISIAEIGDQEMWQSLHLGIAAVSPDQNYVENLIRQAVDFIDRLHVAEITDCQIKILHVSKQGS